MTKKKIIKKGNCFERSFNLLVAGSWDGQSVEIYFGIPMLVHGIVWHDDTGRHVHGWVEDDIFCYDFINGTLKAIPKQRYYELGYIEEHKPRNLFRYTTIQAKIKYIQLNQYYFSDLASKR